MIMDATAVETGVCFQTSADAGPPPCQSSPDACHMPIKKCPEPPNSLVFSPGAIIQCLHHPANCSYWELKQGFLNRDFSTGISQQGMHCLTTRVRAISDKVLLRGGIDICADTSFIHYSDLLKIPSVLRIDTWHEKTVPWGGGGGAA